MFSFPTEHSSKERTAPGQDGPGLRGDQEEQGGDAGTAQRGSLHSWALHGRSEVIMIAFMGSLWNGRGNNNNPKG